MIPENSLNLGFSKEDRGPVVFFLRKRGLNTYTYFKNIKRTYCKIKIQDKLHWHSNSKIVQVPNGLIKMQNELRSLYNRNLINNNWKNKNIFRLLRYTELWIEVYVKLSRKPGSIMSRIDKNTIDGTSLKTIKALQQQVLTSEFRWGVIKRVNIPKPLGKESLLGISKFQDHLVQNVLKEILEKIYDPIFSNKLHSFRPGKSQHTALKYIRKYFGVVVWFIEGNIFSFFDNINYEILMKILAEKIEDKKFLNLIKWGLKSDIILPKGLILKNKITGILQGRVLSSLLSNIYLDKFDKYIENIQGEFNIGIRRASNKIDNKFIFTKGAANLFPVEFKNVLSVDPFDVKFKRLYYVRYADDFIIGIVGNKKEAYNIRNEIRLYLKEKLNLELNIEKTLITHKSECKFFLGHKISVKDVMYKKKNNGKVQNCRQKILTLFVDMKNLIKKLHDLGYCDKRGKPVPNFRFLKQTQSLTNYNTRYLLIGLNNYYKLANDKNRAMNRIKYILKTSIAKMYAAKYKKRTVAAIYKIAGKDLNKRIKSKNPIGATDNALANNLNNIENINIVKINLPLAKHNKPDLSVH